MGELWNPVTPVAMPRTFTLLRAALLPSLRAGEITSAEAVDLLIWISLTERASPVRPFEPSGLPRTLPSL